MISIMDPLYPLIARQFIDDYGTLKGIAVDIGAGTGALALELAKLTQLSFYLIDRDKAALDTARIRFSELSLDSRINLLYSDAQDLTLPDNFADFVYSRGSIGFWDNPQKGISEAYRILKHGGVAIIGAGSGRYISAQLQAKIYNQIKKQRKCNRPIFYTAQQYNDFAQDVGIMNYRIFPENDVTNGCWLEFKK